MSRISGVTVCDSYCLNVLFVSDVESPSHLAGIFVDKSHIQITTIKVASNNETTVKWYVTHILLPWA
jgi:hypothetical protein